MRQDDADPHRHIGAAAPARMVEDHAGGAVAGPAAIVFALSTLATVVLALNQILNLQFFAGVVLIENRYLYLLAAALFPLIFLAFPLRGGSGLAWHDWLTAAIACALLVWFAWQAERILTEGWEYSAPPLAKVFAAILWLLILDALRRASGWPMTIIVGAVSLYPVVADAIPNPLKGNPQLFTDTLAYHLASSESAFGIPMRAFAEIVIGFIIFGVALNHTGGGRFFNDLAFALVGRWRGGAAQVGIISSAALMPRSPSPRRSRRCCSTSRSWCRWTATRRGLASPACGGRSYRGSVP